MEPGDLLFRYVELAIKNDGWADQMITIEEENEMNEIGDLIMDALKAKMEA